MGGTATRHGVTTTGYQRGCRYDLCKAAMREYVRKGPGAEQAKAERAAKAKARRAAAAGKKADPS